MTSNLFEIWLDSEEKRKQEVSKSKSPTTDAGLTLFMRWKLEETEHPLLVHFFT